MTKLNYKQIYQDINTNGYSIIENYINESEKNILLKYSHSLGDGKERELAMHELKRKSDTPAMNYVINSELISILNGIWKERCIAESIEYIPINASNIAVGFARKKPLKDNPSANNEGMTPLHYDHSMVNILVGLEIETKEGEGALILYKNFRKRIKPLILNKILVRIMRFSNMFAKLFKYKKIQYKEDALHIFFGDISLHGVTPIHSGKRHAFLANASRVTHYE
ncbi:MAG: hypothetical protein CMM02_05540 [Rhodopirellula sp.]|nr:hypothetical protein [Rhodopirellula sp.]|tara:strand:+ start:15870 stop:16544 length:675 start_codon:yes stop_codon:yes gene_type:complete